MNIYTIANFLAWTIWPPFILALVIGLPSFVLYLAEICVILGNWKYFQSSYFVIFIMRAILSLANFCCSYIAHRIGRVGLFYSVVVQMPSWVLALGTFVMYYSFHLENLTTAFLLLNRLSSILFPLSYERLWRRHFLAISFIIIMATPLVFTLPVFWLIWFPEFDYNRTPSAITKGNNNFSYTLQNDVPTNYTGLKWSYTTTCAYSGGIFTVVSLLLNLATFWAYLRKSKVAAQNSAQSQRIERKLTIYTLCTFCGQMIMSFYFILQGMRYIEQDHDNYQIMYLAMFNQYAWVNDLCTIALPSWLLLWVNKKIRDVLFGKIIRLSSTSFAATLPIAALGNQQSALARTAADTTAWATSRRPSDRTLQTVSWAATTMRRVSVNPY